MEPADIPLFINVLKIAINRKNRYFVALFELGLCMSDLFTVNVEVDFCASHIIVGHPGKCANLHGHNWKVQACVQARTVNDIGISIDFKDLKSELNAIIDPLDHRHLNDLEPFQNLNPTAENISRYVYQELKPQLPEHVTLTSIILWETDRSNVTYSVDAE